MQGWFSAAIQRIYNSKVGDGIVYLGLRSLGKDAYSVLLYYISDPEETVTIGTHSATFEIDSHLTAFEVHQNITNESPIIADMLENAKPDDVFYDIGAGIGTYICFVGQSVARSVAFEPGSKRFETLQGNVKRNDVKGTLLKAALGEITGAQETNEYIDAPVINGDELRNDNKLPSPDLIKIDVDGPELHVLRGLEETLADGPRLVWIEVHPNRLANRDQSINDLVTFLNRLGFTVDKKSIHGMKSPFIKASR